MASIEEKADTIDSILSIKYLRKPHIKDLSVIKQHLDKAIVVSHSSKLQQMIKKIILNRSSSPVMNNISLIKPSKEQSDAFTKEIENVTKCHGSHSFRLSYLERLLLEDQISLREFKQLRAVVVKHQLALLGELSKKGRCKKLHAKTLKSVENPADDHINPYYKQH